ncbi:MAG TPA: hypothetical protein VG406_05460 [Isosphaeraceae bacterium]|nr:hypothetical protein [Isosphaeraceae bacterium]
MLPPPADRPKLTNVLGLLNGAVEELLLAGLTTASESTRGVIDAALREAARFRLLRLGSSLRAAAEELGRFHRHDPAFSRRRLTFFLSRSWLLGRGIAHALQAGDEKEFDRLTWSRATRPLASVEVVCLGVVKKVAAGAFVAFDFRLRAAADSGPVEAGRRLTWSVVFPVKPGAEVPAEGFLHVTQKQKFNPGLFLEGKTVLIRDARLSEDETGGGRVMLAEGSTVAAGKPFADWSRFLDWSPAPAAARVAAHRPGPLDLDTELQEEVVLRDYRIDPPVDGDEPGQAVYPVTAGRLVLHAPGGGEAEGKALRKGLDALRKLKKDRPPLFGLMHYEHCRLAFQPLTAFGPNGPDYLTISKDVVDKAALLRALKLT